MRATAADCGTEYLAPIVSIKEVGSLDEAIAHINQNGTHHTDIVTALLAEPNVSSMAVTVSRSAGVAGVSVAA